MLRRALAFTAALVVAVPFCGGGLREQVAAAAHLERTHSGWASLSNPGQAEISRTVGRDDVAYWFSRLGGIPALTNAGQHFTAQFLPSGAQVAVGDTHWGLGLAALGHGDRLDPMVAAVPVAEVNRVDYRRGSVDEWYVNGPAGLEQGFTLAERPGGDRDGALTLALGAPGSLTGVVDRGGAGLVLTHGGDGLAYRGLTVSDASGRALPAHLDLHGGQILVRVDDQGAQYPVTVDPFVQAAKLISSDGAAGDRFAFSVAISGTTVVVGAPEATVSGNATQGAAYVFLAPSGPVGTLTQVAKLTASDGAAGTQLGLSVAIDGNTIVAGATATVGGNTAQGAVYVFTQPAGGWAGTLTQAAKLTASDGAVRDALGGSVAISGGTVVAGAQPATVGANSHQGAAYVFTQPANGWGSAAPPQHEAAKLTASDGAALAMFAASVAIAGTTVVVGDYDATVGANAAQGAAYVFIQPSGGWVAPPAAPLHEAAKLTASDGNNDDFLGASVGISGTTVVAGAYQAKVGTHQVAGAAYVFVAPAGGWSGAQHESAKLTASDGNGNDEFGASVAISGNVVVAGAPDAKIGANFSQGAAYVFVAPAAGWTGTVAAPQHEAAKLTAADGATSNFLGLSVGVSGAAVLAGASLATVGTNAKQGAGYLFEAAPAATTTTLGVIPPSPAPAGPGETLTATITPTAAGSVQFLDGATPIGAPVSETNGTASTAATLAPGPHSLSAVFTPTDQSPVSGFTGSTSTPVSYTVNAKRPLCIRICS